MWTGVAGLPGVRINNILPDDVLLHIFHFDRLTYLDGPEDIDPPHPPLRWHRLVHVCRRWRSVVFASPNFLDLNLVCGPRTRVGLMGIWPPFPIILRNMVNFPMPEDYDFNVAIVHTNRVREINLFHLTSSQLQRLASAMQKQFPALRHLMLAIDVFHSRPAFLPNGFLGGSASRLQSFTLDSITFPALPKFLLSATDLVRLTLCNIPHSGYISPETIVTSLAVLANLKSLTIEFESPLFRGGSCPRATSLTLTVLPTLTCFKFRGVSEYLEDLVARIDAPLLDTIWINFFHQLIFDIPQLAQFMRRTTRFQALNEAHVDFEYYGVKVGYLPRTGIFDEKAVLRILCGEFRKQLSSLTQVSTSLFPRISMVEHLYIYQLRHLRSGSWQDNIEITQWLEFFQPFIAARDCQG
jgi:F-box-like